MKAKSNKMADIFADPIEDSLYKFTVEMAGQTEQYLRKLRDRCQSDEEFMERCHKEINIHHPNTECYLFDGRPVFSTEIRFEDNAIIFSLKPFAPLNEDSKKNEPIE